MRPEQIDTIRASFAQASYKSEAVGRTFYQRLFAIAPETRSLFTNDMEAQARKLMDTLGVAVSALRDIPALTRTL